MVVGARPDLGAGRDRSLLDGDRRSGPPLEQARGPGAPAEASYEATGRGLTFSTAPFGQEAEFTGPVKLRLWVKSSTADMDIFATLRLIDPEGRDVLFEGATEPQAPVSQGWLRVSHRMLDAARSTEGRPYHPHRAAEPIVPGQLYQVDVEIWATSIVVPPDYRLALTVEGKDFEWPGATGLTKGSGPFLHLDRDPALYAGTNTIATGEGQASHLLLPLIPKNR